MATFNTAHRTRTVLGLIVIALAAIMAGCNFTTSAELEPATPSTATDLRLTPVSTPWSPTLTSTAFHTATPAPTQTRSSSGNTQTTGNHSGSSSSGSTSSGNSSGSSAPVYVGYVVNTSPPAPACGLVPAGAYNVNIRQWADTNATIIGTLKLGSWIYAARVSGDWYQVQYPGTPVHNAWISSSVVTLTQPCTCTPACANVPPPPPPSPLPQTCTITNHMAHGVMSEPYGNGYPVTQLGPNTTSVVVARLADNSHYRIQTPYGNGWISAVQNVTLNGDCQAVPIEVYNPPPQECRLQIEQAVDVYPQPGWGQPLMQLGAGTSATALARTPAGDYYKIGTQAGNGWVHVLYNVSLTGSCDAVPAEDVVPPPSSTTQTYTSSAYGFAFDYPANWHVRETGGRMIVTSYDPTDGDPPHAAFADPALVKITFQAEAFAGTHEDWVAQYKGQVNGETLRIFAEQPMALPGGIPALRLEMVGGTGGFPVLLAVINGNGVYVEGMMANYANFDRVVGTLRAAP